MWAEGDDMATGFRQLLEQLHQAGAGPSDGQLLARFVAARDEAAFAALVRRHGPMVLGVCRRVLGDFHDAEDAFQATFLVLARKATSVIKGESVGCWLYGTAYRTALRAVALNARRRAAERQVKDMPHPAVGPGEAPDWLPVLDRELSLLPEKYRSAIVLCDLEGHPRREAAGQLGVPEGTLSSRLAAGRKILAKRLARCGVVLSGGVLAVALCRGAASAQVPAALVSSTVRAAALVAAGQLAAVSPPAAVLMREVMKAMLLKKLRVVVGAVVLVLALGVVGLGYKAGDRSGEAQAAPPDRPQNELEALRRENELMKLNLLVVLEKVRAQEQELRDLKARPAAGGGGLGGGGGFGGALGLGGGGFGGAPGLYGGGGITGMPGTSGGGAMGPGAGGMMPPGGTGGNGRQGVMAPDGTGGGMRPPATGGGIPPGGTGGAGPARTTGKRPPQGGTGGAPPQSDPVQEAEAAVKQLREARDKEGQRRATEALQKALDKIKQSNRSERPEEGE